LRLLTNFIGRDKINITVYLSINDILYIYYTVGQKSKIAGIKFSLLTTIIIG